MDKILLKAAIFVFGYIGGYFIGSYFLRKILLIVDPSINKTIAPSVRKVGMWIGACEHFLIVTFVKTGLALLQ